MPERYRHAPPRFLGVVLVKSQGNRTTGDGKTGKVRNERGRDGIAQRIFDAIAAVAAVEGDGHKPLTETSQTLFTAFGHGEREFRGVARTTPKSHRLRGRGYRSARRKALADHGGTGGR